MSTRREFLGTVAAASASSVSPVWAAWPERPVKIVVPYAPGGPVEMAEEAWDAQIDTNLKSIFLTCKHVIPVMEAQGGGSIINTSSASGLRWTGAAQSSRADQLDRSRDAGWRRDGVVDRVDCGVRPAGVPRDAARSSGGTSRRLGAGACRGRMFTSAPIPPGA